MMIQLGETLASPFPDLFGDTIELHGLAAKEDNVGTPIETCFARLSILQAVFSVEAAANCCLERTSLNENKEEFTKIDRKQPLDKFVYLYKLSHDLALDKGNPITQRLAELLKLRNSFAHPRVAKREVIEIPLEVVMSFDGKISGRYMNQEIEPEMTQYLKIPWSPRLLRSLHSEIALKTVIDFFDYFFCDLCSFSPELIANFLFNHGPGSRVSYVLEHQQKLFLDLYNLIGYKPRFLLINSPSDTNT